MKMQGPWWKFTKEGMARAMGVPVNGGYGPVLDAGRWAAFPRRRIFLSTLTSKEPAKMAGPEAPSKGTRMGDERDGANGNNVAG